ncbi:hypothetical protein [Bogoriella caseilytica]|uniref:Uncharacterized protein n=1 Tax=Bogoriella caseilytica TaxID=56055 RepID=A0A3N2BE41_9MICO|nr:hypothetical protein [Bogoriella caseilytica]ROR73495.1 hypothetical protein EDD31_1877 [Bogoriella caseilytica]
MRRAPTRLNRFALALIGLSMILVSLVGVVIAFNLSSQLPDLGLPWPGSDQAVLPEGEWRAEPWLPGALAALGVVVAVLGLMWLIAQLPHPHSGPPFRLHDSAERGLTRVAPEVLVAAVEEQARALPGVHGASAAVYGMAARPEIALRLSVVDSVDLARTLAQVENEVVAGVSTALDSQVEQLSVVIDVDRRSNRSASEITL